MPLIETSGIPTAGACGTSSLGGLPAPDSDETTVPARGSAAWPWPPSWPDPPHAVRLSSNELAATTREKESTCIDFPHCCVTCSTHCRNHVGHADTRDVAGGQGHRIGGRF